MDFKKGVVPTELSFTFQGGFVGTNCSVYGTPPGDAEQQKLCEIYPEDVNTEQRFQLDALPACVERRVHPYHDHLVSSHLKTAGELTPLVQGLVGEDEPLTR